MEASLDSYVTLRMDIPNQDRLESGFGTEVTKTNYSCGQRFFCEVFSDSADGIHGENAVPASRKCATVVDYPFDVLEAKLLKSIHMWCRSRAVHMTSINILHSFCASQNIPSSVSNSMTAVYNWSEGLLLSNLHQRRDTGKDHGLGGMPFVAATLGTTGLDLPAVKPSRIDISENELETNTKSAGSPP